MMKYLLSGLVIVVLASTLVFVVSRNNEQPDENAVVSAPTTSRPVTQAAPTTTGGAAFAPPEVISALEEIADHPEAIILHSSEGLLSDGEPVLPAGSVVAVDEDTWAEEGGVAEVVVYVDLPDGSRDTFAAVLVDTPAGWRLAYTVQGPS